MPAARGLARVILSGAEAPPVFWRNTGAFHGTVHDIEPSRLARILEPHVHNYDERRALQRFKAWVEDTDEDWHDIPAFLEHLGPDDHPQRLAWLELNTRAAAAQRKEHDYRTGRSFKRPDYENAEPYE